MKKCLTPEERKEKQVAIKYLFAELYERLECLDYKPDSLCNAYLAIIIMARKTAANLNTHHLDLRI